MDHGLPQVFGARLATAVAQRDIVCSAVIFDDQRVVHGNVGSTLFEIAHGIPAGPHDLIDELICEGNRASRIINELRLHSSPAVFKTGAVRWRKRNNLKLFSALCPKLEDVFTAVNITLFSHNSIIFRAETLTEH